MEDGSKNCEGCAQEVWFPCGQVVAAERNCCNKTNCFIVMSFGRFIYPFTAVPWHLGVLSSVMFHFHSLVTIDILTTRHSRPAPMLWLGHCKNSPEPGTMFETHAGGVWLVPRFRTTYLYLLYLPGVKKNVGTNNHLSNGAEPWRASTLGRWRRDGGTLHLAPFPRADWGPNS